MSPDFIASNFIYNNELPPLLTAAENKGLAVLWIPLSHGPYEDTALAKYQSAHPPPSPLDTLDKPVRNKDWRDISKKIQAAFEQER